MANERRSPHEIAKRAVDVAKAVNAYVGSDAPIEIRSNVADIACAAIIADAIDGVRAMLDENAIEFGAHLETMGERLDGVYRCLDKIDDRLMSIAERG